MQQIAVLGAAFDPPTKGHADVIEQCLETFAEVWLTPSFQHAFEKKMSDYRLRVEMTQRLIDDLNDERVKLQACEHLIKPNGPVYSYDLMCYLKKQSTNDNLHLVIGPDNAQSFEKFYHHEKLTEEFSPFVAKERRPIRSTNVRQALKERQDVSELLTPSVLNFVKAHELYT